jgi:hypothetical protein
MEELSVGWKGCLPPAVTTVRTIVVVREGVEDDDAEGVDVAGIAAEGREDVDVKEEEIPGIAEVEAGSIVRVDDDSCLISLLQGQPQCAAC